MAVGITLKNLVKVFDQIRAVDNISLTIEPGELFFLLGPSGCGKTTLLRCIAGFNMPDTGEVWIGERDVTHIPAHQRDTGMVFQSYALWPHLTVAENVAFGLEMRKTPKALLKQKVLDALVMVQMGDRADYKPTQLSGGQQQRVALARALVVKPTCLLLDEPLSNLDAKLRLEMRSEIRRVCKSSGLTAVYVTHDQNEALSIADRLVVLNQGRIQQLGTPQAIYRQPNSRFVAEFIGESNFIGGTVIGITSTQIQVDTPIGIITSQPLSMPAVNLTQTVTLSIRPEAIRLIDFEVAVSPNVFSGCIQETLYLGELAQHQIKVFSKTDQSVVLKLFELNPKFTHQNREQQITIYFDPEDVVLLVN